MATGLRGRRDGTVAQGHGHAHPPPGTATLGRKWGAIAFVALALVACHPGAPAKQDGSWAAFNGFYPGMSLKDAQAAGARNCKELTLGAKGLHCEMPPDRLALGPWIAKEGHLEFHFAHEHRLSRMLLYIDGPHFNEVCLALARLYGKPVNDIDYLWHEARTPALISSVKTALRGNPRRSLVEFKFEPELADPRHDFSLTDPRGCLDP
jgi:hypothetical protein